MSGIQISTAEFQQLEQSVQSGNYTKFYEDQYKQGSTLGSSTARGEIVS